MSFASKPLVRPLADLAIIVGFLTGIGGCASSGKKTNAPNVANSAASVSVRNPSGDDHDEHRLVSYRDDVESQADDGAGDEIENIPPPGPEDVETPPPLTPSPLRPAPAAPETPAGTIAVVDVARSIHTTFPMLEAAYQESQIAAGKQVTAWGAFDTKFKASTENGPLGFYENYRHNAGLSRPIYEGGELFGGYRAGRGDFEPWYLERETNEGGELKAGVNLPLLRNREIDQRRADLWRANYDRERADPEIRSQLILFVRDGSIAYWKWIAAGRQYEIGKAALALARDRNEKIAVRVEVGDVDPPVLQDNLQAIAKREAKLIDLERKLQQAAFKLSLYYRGFDGTPVVLTESQRTDFPQPVALNSSQLQSDIAMAIAERPEIAVLEALRKRVSVDSAEARNDMLPTVNAQVIGSQDMGSPTSSKRDKSQFQLEAGVFVEVPLERRKARGKLQTANGKLLQIAAKRRYVEDKIQAEIQSVHAASSAAFQRLEKARESKRLAEYMATVERRKFVLGESNLLSVVLREQYAIEAAEAEVNALFEFFAAQANYNAAMARDWPQ